MSILLSAKDVTKSFGARPLFENLTFVVEEGDRIGLIGPNGAGKSTLLKLMAGITPLDTGEISMRKGLKIGFLAQVPALAPEKSVEDAVLGTHHDDDEVISVAGEIFSRLELNPILHNRVETLSGGWKKRVALAVELVKSPDLLLLDEPTNHLDIESILWLESFLAQSKFATITVTHDRVFLRKVTSRILELDRRNPTGLLNVRGSYENYVEQKQALLSAQNREEQVLRNTLRRETEWLRRGPKARTTKQQARIQAAEELKDAVDELEYRNQQRNIRLNFQGIEKNPKRLIEAKRITKSYGSKLLFKDFNLFIGPKDRIGLLGTNGAGKSTLIRILLGSEEPDSGSIVRSEHLKASYFEQNRETLNPNETLRQAVCPHGDHVNYRGKMVHIQGYLDRFLFRKEQTDMSVGKLSGGEQARVLIARLMLREANVLVLDEPTNDLDVETLDVLQDCLTEFDGAVLLVSHDRYFLDQVATEIQAFPTIPEDKGVVTQFAGLDQWEQWRRERIKQTNAASKTPLPARNPGPPKKRKLSFKETRELEAMEGNIQATEAKLEELQRTSQLAETLANPKKLSEVFQAIAVTQLELDNLYARWAELDSI